MLVPHFSETAPSEGMLAILQQEDSSECVVDQTPQYFFLLLSKVALNTLVLSFWLRSITKSMLGIYSISMYVVDLLLVCSISWAWWFRENLGTHVSVCFTLSHGSAVYSVLPLPVLAAGAIDYAARRHPEASQCSVARAAGHCGVVLMLWVLACSYSYCYTDTELLMVDYKEGAKALVCPVQASIVVSFFSLNLSLAVGFILLLYYRGLPHWVDQASKLSSQRAWILVPRSNQALSAKLETLEVGPIKEAPVAAVKVDQQPPLFVSLTLCFALNWTPYLLMSMACDTLGFTVPAYATVNLLWSACANSLLEGMVIWYSSTDNTPPYKSSDDICEWSIYWLLSKGYRWQMASETPHDKLSSPETADMAILEM
ncbi:probable G-protein coupled receptor 160 [Electrophorus electricus]|uniref:probable G-protein coupled receptor 160 n=1 Tax=Electrophorus electricus TaxID=8005 RepID=UPI0015D00A6A|nr:probable G-protein coupled receptor 160 [Electrophorus electricus]